MSTRNECNEISRRVEKQLTNTKTLNLFNEDKLFIYRRERRAETNKMKQVFFFKKNFIYS